MHGNIEPNARHFDIFSSLLSCSPYTLYTVQFQFTRHSLDLSDNVLYDWLFPHYCICTVYPNVVSVFFSVLISCLFYSLSIQGCSYLMVTTQHGYLVLFDVFSGKMLLQNKMHCGSVEGLVWEGKKKQLVTVGGDCAAYIWDTGL